MKITLIAGLLIFLLPLSAPAQFATLEAYDQKRLDQTKNGMLVLGSWATANIGWGLIAQGQTSGLEQSFHQMNAGWNLINLGIAGLGYFSARKEQTLNKDLPEQTGLQSILESQHKLEKALLFNAGLDVGYMMAGLFLNERGKDLVGAQGERQQGFGQSIILQGGFLFAYDLISFFIHRKHRKALPTKFF